MPRLTKAQLQELLDRDLADLERDFETGASEAKYNYLRGRIDLLKFLVK